MAVIVQTTEGPIELSDVQIQAVEANATYLADLTAHVLETVGFVPSEKPTALPGACFRELVAIVQIRLWEQQGLDVQKEFGLPSGPQTADEFRRRLETGIDSFRGPNSTKLSSDVLRVWMTHFAWDGQAYFNSDFLIRSDMNDEILDRLAEFFWEHRHLMTPTEI